MYIRVGQGFRVDFTIRRQRHLVKLHVGRRNHVVGELLSQETLECILVNLPVSSVVGTEMLHTTNLTHLYRFHLDAFVFTDERLNLTQLDTEAT